LTERRVPGAPRLVEWTGERLVPWAPDPPVIYEHYHRYLFAGQLAADRDVLDLASGEGYGAALLADSARSVVGVDIDVAAVEHSRLNYSAPNLDFKVADARGLADFEEGSFGAVVAFEVIEHVAEQEQVLAEIERVLTPDGVVVLSTPDRIAYSEGGESQNPFHVHELSTDELVALLHRRFANVATWAQRTVTGSALVDLADRGDTTEGLRPFIVEHVDDEWRLVDGMSPMYVVAVASKAELPALPRDSVLIDPGQERLISAQDARAQSEAAARAAHEELRDHIAQLDDARRELLELGDTLQGERLYVAELQRRAAGDEQVIVRLQDQLAHAAHWRRGVEESVTWRLFQRARALLYGTLGGRGSLPGRVLQALLRGVGRVIR
jgi:SAM-dependent methyltransferase